MPRKGPQWDSPYNGPARQADGLTVYVSEQTTGARRVLVRRDMPLRAALREVCWQLDSWPGDWRVDVISTPTSILSDLRGRTDHRVKHGPVEGTLLGGVGRMDLHA